MARSALKTIFHIYAFYEKKVESLKIDMGHTTVYTGMEHTRKYNRAGCNEIAY